MNRREVKQYKYITLWKEEDDDIIFFSYTPNVDLTLKVAKEMVDCRLDYAHGNPAYYLIDATNLFTGTKDARDYLSDPQGGLKGILAGAFISNRVLTTVSINLFFKLNKPTVPARFFTKKEEAIQWLIKIKSSNNSNSLKTNSTQ